MCFVCVGLGGGYNERENIEYIQREDSDDEYDDVNGLALLCRLCRAYKLHVHVVWSTEEKVSFQRKGRCEGKGRKTERF